MITNVMSYLEASAGRWPERVAAADAGETVTYRRLWRDVCAMGAELYRRAGCTGGPVAVCIRHDVTDLLAFFAVVYSGNFYVPVDMSLPRERLESMARTVRPMAVVAREGERGLEAFGDAPVWTPEELRAGQAPPAAPWRAGKDTDPLYVIFTSGSTGEPKGVAVSHRSVIDMAEQFTLAFGFREGTVFGNQAPFDFDVSVKDIYLSAKVGGTVEILEKKLFSFPKLLMERLKERRVDTIIWAVPALNIIARLNAFQSERPQGLKNIMFSGEIMPPGTLRYWMERLPGARFVNLYGPTEITCNCTYYVVPGPEGLADAVPIGAPFANCSVFLLDGERLVTQEGEVGELCVTGSCLALGYYGRRELTEAAFPQNPLNGDYPERMYRTGDLGCRRGGELLFLGRKDTQIKHMGHRIELTELTLCANTLPGVDNSACVYDEEGARIVLFYQGTAGERELLARLRERLPRYMLPAALKRVDAFPMTRTGKIDRKILLLQAKGETT